MGGGNFRLAVIFGLIALLAIAGMGVVGASLRNQQAAQPVTQNDQRWSVHHVAEWIEKHDKLLIPVFTVILAIATGLLWWATRDLVHKARDTAQRQLRAYVGIYQMEMTISPFETGGFAFLAHVELRNFGQTPAYNLRVTSWSKFDLPGAQPDPRPVGVIPDPSIAFPHAGVHVNIGHQISDDVVQAVRRRERVLHMSGIARYEDAFKKEHYFRFNLVSQHQMVGSGEVYSLGPHPTGFDAD